jgi:hypothetical protein
MMLLLVMVMQLFGAVIFSAVNYLLQLYWKHIVTGWCLKVKSCIYIYRGDSMQHDNNFACSQSFCESMAMLWLCKKN